MVFLASSPKILVGSNGKTSFLLFLLLVPHRRITSALWVFVTLTFLELIKFLWTWFK